MRQKLNLTALSSAMAVIVAGTACAAGTAWAQAIPDAGQTLREIERADRSLRPPVKEAPRIEVAPERPAMTAVEGLRINVQSFRITGAQQFSEAELAGLLTEWTGRSVTLADLQAAAASITRHYREQGFMVARAYIPAQTLQGGTVEIAVLEGRIGKVEVRNTSRLSDATAQRLASQVQPGDAVRQAELERSLMLLNEMPGVGRASAALQPGASVGLSDLVVALEPGAPVTGSIDADNHGNRYSGRYRAGGTMYLNSPLQIGDQFSARVLGSSEDLYYGRLAYRVPVGSSGLSVGAAYSASRYDLGKEFAALDVNGTARTATLFASYPLIRTSIFSLTGTLSVDDRDLRDRIDAVDSRSDKSVRSATLGVVGNGLLPRGSYAFSVGYTGGDVDLETDSVRAADAVSARTQGGYGKLVYTASGQYIIGSGWSVYGGLSGQLASQNLDSSEKFSLGGADGVRAYPQGEASADEGYLLTGEIRYGMPRWNNATMHIGAFIDYGSVRINKDRFAEGDNHRQLSAVGFSFNLSEQTGYLVRTSLAWKLGSEDAQSEPDRNARFWLQGIKYF